MGKRSHQLFKDKAKTHLADLEHMISDLRSARRESRIDQIAFLEDQVHQMLRQWRAELEEPSPASSFLGDGIRSDLSSEIRKMLNFKDEEDDATSKLEEVLELNGKDELPPFLEKTVEIPEDFFVNLELPENGLMNDGDYENIPPAGSPQNITNSQLGPTNVNYQHFNMYQEMPDSSFQQFPMHQQYYTHDVDRQNEVSHRQEMPDFSDLLSTINLVRQTEVPHHQEIPDFSDLLSTINLPPSAFLGPKCALWDCQRPPLYQDFCSNFHATLATSEGEDSKPPVLRPGGIDLKDGPLFSALTAKIQGKSVGIPECVGASSAKCPWNNPVFDLSFFEGESLREWLYFDKPRRAFESGNRKQRSLPDYQGRGWHESRKQLLPEYGGMKRSYYMDPQPLYNQELHLFEYELKHCDTWALYRLELKLVDSKKSNKAKVNNDQVVALEHQMGRLNAENAVDSKRYAKGRAKATLKDVSAVPDVGSKEEKDMKVANGRSKRS